jgi:hypothetical protein
MADWREASGDETPRVWNLINLRAVAFQPGGERMDYRSSLRPRSLALIFIL